MLETNDIKEEDSPFGYELINILKDFCRRHHRTSADSSGILELDSTHIYLPWMFMQLNPKTDSPTYIGKIILPCSFRSTWFSQPIFSVLHHKLVYFIFCGIRP